MVLHLGGKFLSFLAWLRAKRLLSDWLLGTVNIDSDWLPRGLSKRFQPQKELKIYSNDTWNARLEALNTTDNSLWEAQRFLKNKRSQIPTLNCATGMAVTDPQKANLLANTIKNNFIENNRMQDNYDQDDEVVTSAVNTFLSSPFYSN
ncbi:hypothetical protein TNCV_1404711 [Trichonephila clavipes]|nr:hypothetical protein TNCV_1404711 [Trichonephila clavipes]